MKQSCVLGIFTLAAVLILFAGCDREVVTEVKTGAELSTCFTCHDDNELDLVAAQRQWEESTHGSGANVNRNRLYSSRYESCEPCHTAEGFVASVTGVPASGDHFTSIGCFTCHMPHTNGNLDVRVTGTVTLANGDIYDRGASNLCARCHQSRSDASTTVVDTLTLDSRFGPHHSNQADMLEGRNAYEYAGYSYGSSAHTSTALNGCIDCHMSAAINEAVGGHSFNMRDEGHEIENLAGCNVAGCHTGSNTITTFDRDGLQEEMEALLSELKEILTGAGLLDEEGAPMADRVVTDADSSGAVYNLVFVEEDRSLGIHNTEYAKGLLQSSINFMTTGDPNGGK
ncbi:MAG: hypothetical protein KJ970_09105 [Candidatus Eisenbacteria bacterium]|uniref:Cytochrome c-552/4 domain-containing protein n=1 Tax=Eiseniibacteriota bacterium TaxID=2212470 RepID=A0A948W6F4_UNCEI|nr:hypothetical protein [Candidatus Eisenbacteria bacterium]